MEGQNLVYCLTHRRHSINTFFHLCMLGLYMLVCELSVSLGPALQPDKAQPGNEGSSCHAFSFPSRYLCAFTKALPCPSHYCSFPCLCARLTLHSSPVLCLSILYSRQLFQNAKWVPEPFHPSQLPTLCFL